MNQSNYGNEENFKSGFVFNRRYSLIKEFQGGSQGRIFLVNDNKDSEEK